MERYGFTLALFLLSMVQAIGGNTPPGDGIENNAVYIYVATNGNDLWSGRLAAPNSNGTDGPLATLHQARLNVQSIDKAALTRVHVQFRAGTYYLPVTEQFSAADSGTASTEIVYENYPGESAVLSGGVRVQNWTNLGSNKWQTVLPASIVYFENLFVNGTRRLRPRIGGYLGNYQRFANTPSVISTVYVTDQEAKKPENMYCSVKVADNQWECFDRFNYLEGDPIGQLAGDIAAPANNLCGLPAGNPNLVGDIELLDFEQFSTSKLRVSCIDTQNQIVYLTGPTTQPQNNYGEVGFIPGNRYLVENVKDELQQAGQWFLDRSTVPWTLTYLALSGEDPNVDSVTIPQTQILVLATDLQYVTFRGLGFEYDNYTVPAQGHPSKELEPDITPALSFQNSQHLAFDYVTMNEISGTGLEIVSCLGDGASPDWCVDQNSGAVTAYISVTNSAFYDIGALPMRLGEPRTTTDNDSNVPQFLYVENNVVEGYGRIIPSSFGIGQGEGHDNVYTHNEVYDGYHCAISISESASDNTPPTGHGAFNNTFSFNHVYNLLQGIMNDGGAMRIESGNNVFTASGNRILNNKVHDVSDASAMDPNGYGGDGIYLDNQTGLVDVENNLVYRVSGNAVYTPQGPAMPQEANFIRNNILAYARQAMIAVNNPYPYTVPAPPASINQVFVVSNNLIYFDRTAQSTPMFYVQGGCTYSAGYPYIDFQQSVNNLYWRTDGTFLDDIEAFHVQSRPGTNSANPPCTSDTSHWDFYSFWQWRSAFGEDAASVVADPYFANASYPADDYRLLYGSPGVGFVVFDTNQAGRIFSPFNPPPVGPTFQTAPFNPQTDF